MAHLCIPIHYLTSFYVVKRRLVEMGCRSLQRAFFSVLFRFLKPRAATQGLTDHSSFSSQKKLKTKVNSWILLPFPNFRTGQTLTWKKRLQLKSRNKFNSSGAQGRVVNFSLTFESRWTSSHIAYCCILSIIQAIKEFEVIWRTFTEG